MPIELSSKKPTLQNPPRTKPAPQKPPTAEPVSTEKSPQVSPVEKVMPNPVLSDSSNFKLPPIEFISSTIIPTMSELQSLTLPQPLLSGQVTACETTSGNNIATQSSSHAMSNRNMNS